MWWTELEIDIIFGGNIWPMGGYSALHYFTLQYTTLYYIILHYFTLHCILYSKSTALCIALFGIHYTHCTVYCTAHILHYTENSLYWVLQCTAHILHCTVHALHCILHCTVRMSSYVVLHKWGIQCHNPV